MTDIPIKTKSPSEVQWRICYTIPNCGSGLKFVRATDPDSARKIFMENHPGCEIDDVTKMEK